MNTKTEPSACPPDAREAVAQLCGAQAVWETVTSRRGCTVWRASGPSGTWAVKLGEGEGAASVSRETIALDRMALVVPAFAYGAKARHGFTKETAWLIVPWFSGPSTWERFQPVRDGRPPQECADALAAAVELCEGVEALHRAGWVHGDLQPTHAFHTNGGLRLIDCSGSWSMSLPPSAYLRGGLIHLMPPTFAAALERGPVGISQPDETYTLAATLWWAATNEWPLDYPGAAIDPSAMTAVVLRSVIATGRVPLRESTWWPEFAEPLHEVLRARQRDRATAGQLAAMLREVPCA